jgi:hypothetical protein
MDGNMIMDLTTIISIVGPSCEQFHLLIIRWVIISVNGSKYDNGFSYDYFNLSVLRVSNFIC